MKTTNATIRFTMHVIEGTKRAKHDFETEANLFLKKDTYFLFFDEENDEDKSITKCRFEIKDKHVRLRRNGQIVVDQTHQLGVSTDGYIKTDFGVMETRITTTKLNFIEINANHYRLELNYVNAVAKGGRRSHILTIEILKDVNFVN